MGPPEVPQDYHVDDQADDVAQSSGGEAPELKDRAEYVEDYGESPGPTLSRPEAPADHKSEDSEDEDDPSEGHGEVRVRAIAEGGEDTAAAYGSNERARYEEEDSTDELKDR